MVLVTVLLPFVVYILPPGSKAANDPFPDVLSIVETPLGVIFEILTPPVYTFPAASRAIPLGPLPVVPSMVETPLGVIFVTLESL